MFLKDIVSLCVQLVVVLVVKCSGEM